MEDLRPAAEQQGALWGVCQTGGVSAEWVSHAERNKRRDSGEAVKCCIPGAPSNTSNPESKLSLHLALIRSAKLCFSEDTSDPSPNISRNRLPSTASSVQSGGAACDECTVDIDKSKVTLD